MNGVGVIKTLLKRLLEYRICFHSFQKSVSGICESYCGTNFYQGQKCQKCCTVQARSAVCWCSLSGVKTFSVFVQSILERGIAESPPNLHCYSCKAPFTSSGDSILTFKVGFMFYSWRVSSGTYAKYLSESRKWHRMMLLCKG